MHSSARRSCDPPDRASEVVVLGIDVPTTGGAEAQGPAVVVEGDRVLSEVDPHAADRDDHDIGRQVYRVGYVDVAGEVSHDVAATGRLSVHADAAVRYAHHVDPLLLAIPTSDPDQERERHQPVLEHLRRIAERGRRDGEFDRELPVSWIVATTMALGHAAGEQVRTGQLSAARAKATLRRSLARMLDSPDR